MTGELRSPLYIDYHDNQWGGGTYMITIEFDIQENDRYGRLQCYVYLLNGKMLNEEIVRAGYANIKTIPPNVKYKDRFLNAFKYAKEIERGLWEENK